MTSRGRLAWAMAVAGTTFGTLPGSAFAGPTQGELDLRFTGTTTNWSTFPGRTDQRTYDPCSPTERLVGIGAFVIEALPPAPNRSGFAIGKGYNVTIRPVDQYPEAPGIDSNEQIADNLFKVDNDLTLGETTTCASSAPAISYPSAKKRSPKRSRTTVKVECGGGKRVLSGGGHATGPFRSQRLVSSVPYDSDDPGSKPDDGWKVAVDNLRRERRKVRAYAICGKVPGLSYQSDDFKVKKRSRKHVEVACPAGEFALGGGVKHTADFRKATLVASRAAPFPSFVSWLTEVDNLSRERSTGRTFAICHA